MSAKAYKRASSMQVQGFTTRVLELATCLDEKIANRKATHVKTHKLLQTCKQVVTSLFTSC